MTISKVQSNFVNSTASVTSQAITLPVGVTNGNLLVVAVGVGNVSDTVTGPSGWTKAIGNLPSGTNDQMQTQLWYLVVGSAQAGQTSWTWTFSASHTVYMTIEEWNSTTGWQASPLDQTAQFPTGTPATTTTVQSGATATTTQANELWIAQLAYVSAAQTESGLTAGWTLDVSSTSSTRTTRMLYQIASATGAAACQFTIGTAEYTSGVVATFKPATASTNTLGTETQSTFKTRAVLATPTRDTFKTRAVLATGTRDTFKTRAVLSAPTHSTFKTRAVLTSPTHTTFKTRMALLARTESTFKIKAALMALATSAHATFQSRTVLATRARSTFQTRISALTTRAIASFQTRIALLATRARSAFQTRISALATRARSTFKTRIAALTAQTRATFKVNAVAIIVLPVVATNALARSGIQAALTRASALVASARSGKTSATTRDGKTSATTRNAKTTNKLVR